MNREEFVNIMNKGFNIQKVNKGDTDLKCLICGTDTGLTTKNSSQLECLNKHRINGIDYLIEYAEARDGLLQKQIDETCCFNYTPKAKSI